MHASAIAGSALTLKTMPLVRIALKVGRTPEYKQKLGDCVFRAMRQTLNVPEGDRFQVITEHDTGLIYDPHYFGIERTDGFTMIQVTLSSGRTREAKRAFYALTAQLLREELQVRKEDVFINLVEVTREDWSFGNGEAQYVPVGPGS